MKFFAGFLILFFAVSSSAQVNSEFNSGNILEEKLVVSNLQDDTYQSPTPQPSYFNVDPPADVPLEESCRAKSSDEESPNLISTTTNHFLCNMVAGACADSKTEIKSVTFTCDGLSKFDCIQKTKAKCATDLENDDTNFCPLAGGECKRASGVAGVCVLSSALVINTAVISDKATFNKDGKVIKGDATGTCNSLCKYTCQKGAPAV